MVEYGSICVNHRDLINTKASLSMNMYSTHLNIERKLSTSYMICLAIKNEAIKEHIPYESSRRILQLK